MQTPDHRGPPQKAFERGRYSAQHIAAGLALAGAAIALSSLFAMRSTPATAARLKPGADRLGPGSRRPPPAILGLIWPPLFTALTLAGLRIWNAPPSRQRTRALTLWSLLQGFNALWMALGPRRLGGRLTTAVATAGTAAAFAWQAHGVDAGVEMTARGWRGLASGVGLRRRAEPQPTVH